MNVAHCAAQAQLSHGRMADSDADTEPQEEPVLIEELD
jgi:hypothetical protein